MHVLPAALLGGGEERFVLLEDLVLNYALALSRPDEPTWQITRGSQSRIDYILYRVPQAQLRDDTVAAGPEEVLVSDHRLILVTMSSIWGRSKQIQKSLKE